MRVNAWTGFRRLLGLGPQIRNSVDQQPDGLLLHENLLIPLHLGMRQYWRDWDSLERGPAPPHRDWWKHFLRDSGGTGFWHETYFMRGGMEAIYDDVQRPAGFLTSRPPSRHAAPCSPHGTAPAGGRAAAPVVEEAEFYSVESSR